jgi:hypothetical protein
VQNILGCKSAATGRFTPYAKSAFFFS